MQRIMSGALNFTQVVGIFTRWTMDHFGRRPFLLWASFFMTFHSIVAILVGPYTSD